MDGIVKPQVEYWVEFQDGSRMMKADAANGDTLGGYRARFDEFVKKQKTEHSDTPIVRTWVNFDGKRVDYHEEKPERKAQPMSEPASQPSNQVQFEFWLRFDNGLVEKETFSFEKGNTFIGEYTSQFAEFKAKAQAKHPDLIPKDSGTKVAGPTVTQAIRKERRKALTGGDGSATKAARKAEPQKTEEEISAAQAKQPSAEVQEETSPLNRRRRKRRSARADTNLTLPRPALETGDDLIKRRRGRPKGSGKKKEQSEAQTAEVPVLIIHKTKRFSRLQNSLIDANRKKDKLLTAYKMLDRIGQNIYRNRLITELHPEVTAAEKSAESLKAFFDLINNGKIYDRGAVKIGENTSSAVRPWFVKPYSFRTGEKEEILEKKRLEVKEQITSFKVLDVIAKAPETKEPEIVEIPEPEAKKPEMQEEQPKAEEAPEVRPEEKPEPKENVQPEEKEQPKYTRIQYDDIGVIVNETEYDHRIKMYFKEKPQYEIREVLKKNAFRWSPRNVCWQRTISKNARLAVKDVVEKMRALQGEKEREKSKYTRRAGRGRAKR